MFAQYALIAFLAAYGLATLVQYKHERQICGVLALVAAFAYLFGF